MGVDQRRAAGLAVRIVGAGPQKQAIGVGAGVHRTVVGLAQREGARQRGLQRQFLRAVVAHSQPALGRQPLVHAAVVPGALGIVPGVRRQVAQRLAGRQRGRQRIGRQALAGVRLDEHVAVGRGRAVRVGPAARAGQGAVVVVEAAVLLHQDDDVVEVAQRAAAALGGHGGGARDQGGDVRIGSGGHQ